MIELNIFHKIYLLKTMKMNKKIKCRLILEGMIFLNIPTENFLNLKNEYGGIDGLYNFISNKLC
jgi:hypothetical protein